MERGSVLDYLTEPKFQWLALLDEVELVAIDTETNTLKLHQEGARTNGFSLALKYKGEYFYEYFPVKHIRGKNYHETTWEPILAKALSKVAIFHNRTFDTKALSLLGYKVDRFYDTTRLCHLLNENAPYSYTLESCCAYYKVPGKVKSVIFESLLKVFGWNEIAGSEIAEYAEADALATYKLFEVVTAKLAKSEPKVFEYWKKIEADNFRVLYAMKEKGVGVDINFCKEWEERCYTKMKEIIDEIEFDPGKPTNLKKVLHEDLGLPIITKFNKKTQKSSITFDEDAMERYELMLENSKNPLARKILEFRGWKGAVTRYYGPYQSHVYSDGRIRPDYKSHGTVTGRFSCSEPNLQQIPKETDKPWNGRVKECFIPMGEHELWEFDYSQLELRLGAAYGRDEALLKIFNDPIGRDIFDEMSKILGWSRFRTKTFVYSINYGAGVQRIMDVFNCTKEEAQRYISEFYESYPGLRRANYHAKAQVEEFNYIELWSGRRRHFNSGKDGYKGFNSLIQGGSADLVKNVMNRIHRELPEVRIILQVHDSLWFELPISKSEQMRSDIRAIMETPLNGFGELPVIFKVDEKKVGGRAYAV